MARKRTINEPFHFLSRDYLTRVKLTLNNLFCFFKRAPIQSLDATVPPKNLIVLHFQISDKKYSEIEKMRTRGMGAKTEMEPVEVFARIKTVSNTEVSKSIIPPLLSRKIRI